MSSSPLKLRHDYEADRLSWCDPETNHVVEELIVPSTSSGCAIEQFRVSRSGSWIVTARSSGQGEWGYDVIRSRPLERFGGIPERIGYLIDLPEFAADESFVIGGYGELWLGGWWAHPDDDCYETASRGGVITFGWLFRHFLPSQEVAFHEMRMNLPSGWFPDDPENEKWMGPRNIAPLDDGGVRMVLPGDIPFEYHGPLPDTIDLPVPHPDGNELLNAAG